MDNTEELKKKINGLVWEYAPEKITLKESEVIAWDILCMIENGKDIQGIQVDRITN